MSLLSLILAIVVVGIVLWAINKFVPMDAKVKQLLSVVVILILVVWVLNALGLFAALDNVRVPRAR